jgi:uncharacterized protein YbjT (DUF2867 family)
MTIAITTPTGHVGSRVTQLLVQAGVTLRVLVRDAKRLDPAISQYLDVVECDLTDSAAVTKATAGVDTLFWVNPPTTMEPDPIDAYRRFGEIAASAVEHNGIPRVVFQSSIGAERRSGMGEIDGLAQTEMLLEETAASVLHIRCGYFFTNLLMSVDDLRNGMLYTNANVDQLLPWVDPRDVGDVVAARLLAGSWKKREVEAVHGPKDLSFADAAAIISAATGRTVNAVHVADDELGAMLAGFGMTEKQVGAIVGMLSGARTLEPEQPRSIRSTTPTSLGSWAFEYLRPALDAVDAD